MIQYKIIKRGQPGVAGGGIQKYYAFPVYTREMDIDDIAKRLSSNSTLNKTDIVAAISGLMDLIAEELSNGTLLRLGNLGTFRISIRSRGEETAEEVTSSSVRSAKVLFRPTTYFEEALGTLKYEKAQDLIVNPDDIPPEDDNTTEAGS